MIGRIAPHDKYGRATRGWHAWLYDRMALPDGIRIMELGCGPGKLRGETIAPLSNFLIKEFNHHHGVLRITKDAGLLIACFCRRLPAGSAFGNIFHCVRFGSDKVYCTHSGAAGQSVQRERLGLRCLLAIRHAPTRRRNPAEIRLGGPGRAGVEPPGGGLPALSWGDRTVAAPGRAPVLRPGPSRCGGGIGFTDGRRAPSCYGCHPCAGRLWRPPHWPRVFRYPRALRPSRLAPADPQGKIKKQGV